MELWKDISEGWGLGEAMRDCKEVVGMCRGSWIGI